MKFRAYATLIAFIAIATGLAFWLPPQQARLAAMMAAVFTIVTVFSGWVGWSKGAAFIERQPATVVRAGYAVTALAVVGFIWEMVQDFRVQTSADATQDHIEAWIIVFLLGSLLISTPKIARQTNEAKARQTAFENAKRQGIAAPRFSGARHGFEALISVLRDWPMFLQIVGPWILLPAAGLGICIALSSQAGLGKTASVVVLLGLLAAILVAGLGLATVFIAWSRWRLEGARPARWIALPDGPAWSIAWRLWVFVGLWNRVIDWTGTKAAQLATGAGIPFGPMLGDLVGAGFTFLLVMLFSSLGLRIPAIAMRDKAFDRVLAATEGRRMWPGLPLGLAVTAAPYVIFSFAVNVIYRALQKTDPAIGKNIAVLGLFMACNVLIFFFAATAAMAFLSDAYREAKSRLRRL